MIAYLDCFSGISGDMFLGALIDAGVPPEELLKGLPIHVEIKARKIERAGIKATRVELNFKREKIHRLQDFKRLLSASELPENIKSKAEKVIEDLFTVESVIHGHEFDTLHLHELGSPDTLIDIVGTLRGLEFLGIKRIFCSPVNVGSGLVKTSHGILPVPGPATLELLKGFPVLSRGPEDELTTPTGAAF